MSKRNNTDDLMQLALYMVPKYMKRIQKYNKMFANSDNEKEYYEQEYADNKEIFDFIQKNIIEKNKDLLKSESEDKTKKIAEKTDTKDKDEKEKKEEKDKPEEKKEDNKKEASKKHSSHRKEKNLKKLNGEIKKDGTIMFKNKCLLNCNSGVMDLLNKFGSEKLDLYVKNDTSDIFKHVNVVHSDGELVRFNDGDSDIVVPIKNIVGLYSTKLSSMEKLLEEDNYKISCPLEKTMREYFSSLKGKAIEICTKGEESFKHLKNKTVTNVGKGFVIVDNNTMVTFYNILFVKELKKEQGTPEQKTDNKNVPKI
ncbi:hypothetical protein [Clostridium autoethanogenum]|uniref:hypothetical protein n=1 Tax=Clostridium autoethanogenum TaxID=84023 RepID=UPI000404D918|nr:hypothetical protein [Clostridium autoethanogenum]ALU37764.1 Hypothetical protein CLAU_3337 [Clostridium autoethanogenum DSM 10061]OVY49885.1 hypothetical protein WX72_03264 [Clostridium autoethanogenum]